ncbi:TIGR02269 family lipoprotein [Hyalangium rubrum]|uniref:TIGR02269 family lipoprotein n=1 Tax=Hyalangium rubrum TaxID=3103134 RepID=A0ABU5GYD4_9BACT|nr:TIGR02269 family lipoprotein [Hyalangium sp. s54d21]MDY7225704.1 TIGR02269 family lipoprotein [Hyalangium sp. s54d21]
MRGFKEWCLFLACCLLAACVATRPIEGTDEGCEVASEAASFEQLCSEDGTLGVLCDESQCGAYRCREVVERLTAGQRVLARHLRPPLPTSPGQGGTSTRLPPLPSPGPGIERYRGSAQEVSGDTRPVFIIHWGPQPKSELLPSQKQLLAEAEAYRKKPHEGHHIYPQAFRQWFTEKGIDIDAYILPLEVPEHRRIHRGANGGPWNAAWDKFINENPGAPKEEIHRHAGQLIYEFGLFGVILPYKLWTLHPPPFRNP